MPLVIYWIGPRVIGDFGGIGYSDFFNTLTSRILGGEFAAWFFVLSPYLFFQTLRLTWMAWRSTSQPAA